MYRAIPYISKIIHKKDQVNEQNKHEKKLLDIQKSKSEYYRIGKAYSVPRNNRYWNDKLNEIKEKNKKLAQKIGDIAEPEFLVVDNNGDSNPQARRTFYNKTKSNFRKPDTFQDPRNSSVSQGFEQRRRKEMLKVMVENVTMRNRINRAPAHYRVSDMKVHTDSHKKFLQMHCEFPLVLEKPNPKPVSAIIGNLEQAPAANKSQTNSAINNNSESVNPQVQMAKRSSDNSNSTLNVQSRAIGGDKSSEKSDMRQTPTEGFKKKNKTDYETTAQGKSKSSEREQQGETKPQNQTVQKKHDNLLVMSNHFLNKGLIVIYENVISYKKRHYHCSATKPKE